MTTRKLSIFTRIGGKYNVREKIVKFFPHQNFSVYIEPFLGGGQVFLELEKKDNVQYILNDKNKDIYDIWKDLQVANPQTMRNFNWNGSEKLYDELYDSKPISPEKRLYRNLYLSYYSFSGTRKKYAPKPSKRGSLFLKNIEVFQEKLKGVKILNQDYKSVIQKYDNKDAVIYLDPPYTNKEKLYENQSIDPYDLAKVCKTIKGKFVLSYDLSDKVKDAFKDFYFYKIKIPYTSSYQNYDRYEYIITNFPRTMGGLLSCIHFLDDRSIERLKGAGFANLKHFLNA